MTTRHTYRATIAYDGAGFSGFKKQRDQRTIEGAIVSALKPWIPELPKLACGGRTDRGVHATAQVISFWSRGRLPLEQLWRAIDCAEIAVLELREVPRSFHATFSAISRHYTYLLHEDIDASLADAMVSALVGRRCFSAFARDTPKGQRTVRHLMKARARAFAGGVRFDFRANGFLKRQVRAMVATTAREARARSSEDALVAIADSGNRRLTSIDVPPGGLYLSHVGYG